MAEEISKTAPTELPAVAKSVFVPCKKCGEDRYHTVLAHPTPTSAKMKCEVCGASKTMKFGGAPKKAKATSTGAKKTTRTRVNKADEHKAEYEKLINNVEDNAVKYDMKGAFEANQKLNHPKFGVGVVRTIFADKIEVVFQDEVRNLVHNRV